MTPVCSGSHNLDAIQASYKKLNDDKEQPLLPRAFPGELTRPARS